MSNISYISYLYLASLAQNQLSHCYIQGGGWCCAYGTIRTLSAIYLRRSLNYISHKDLPFSRFCPFLDITFGIELKIIRDNLYNLHFPITSKICSFSLTGNGMNKIIVGKFVAKDHASFSFLYFIYIILNLQIPHLILI